MTGHFTSYETRTDHELATATSLLLDTQTRNQLPTKNTATGLITALGSPRSCRWSHWLVSNSSAAEAPH